MAKQKQLKQGTIEDAIVVAAMERSAKRIKTERDLPDLPAGSHDVELSIAIQGDIVVGDPTEGGKAPKVDANELLGALAHLCELWYDDFNLADAMLDAVDLLKDRANRRVVDDTTAQAKLLARTAATEKRYLKTTPARRGAITGAPYLRIAGTVSATEIEIEVNG